MVNAAKHSTDREQAQRELITKAEFARRRGFSPAYVSKIVKQGRIPTHDGQIDYAEASAILDATTNIAKKQSQPPVDAPAPKSPPGDERGPDAVGDLLSFNEARTHKENWEAKLKELAYMERSGELVEVQTVRREQYARARQVRASIEAIPERISAQLAAEADEVAVRLLLNDELRNVIEELSDAARTG